MDFEAAKSRLAALGCHWSKPALQRDTIFFRAEDDPITPKVGKIVMRIREEGGFITLTAKRHVTSELDCLEEEVHVEDAGATSRLLLLLGFVQTLAIVKLRQRATGFGFNFCLDRVEGLGDFLEIESLSSETTAEAPFRRLEDLLTTLALSDSERVEMGYDTLVLVARRDTTASSPDTGR
jgi:adenylate cyclase class 2